MVANKTFRSVWGLSFWASVEDDSGLLLKEVELMVPRRRLWNWGRWLPCRSLASLALAALRTCRIEPCPAVVDGFQKPPGFVQSEAAETKLSWRFESAPPSPRASPQSSREVIPAAEGKCLEVRMVSLGDLGGSQCWEAAWGRAASGLSSTAGGESLRISPQGSCCGPQRWEALQPAL